MPDMHKSGIHHEADKEKSGYESLLPRSSMDSDPSESPGEPIELAFKVRKPHYRALAFVGKATIIVMALWGLANVGFLIFGAVHSRNSTAIHSHVHEHQHEHVHKVDTSHLEKVTIGGQTFISCSCGTSHAEALSRGCKFDGIAAAFLPAHCRDDELLEEFDRSGENPDGSWNYWRDPKMQHRLNLSELGELADQQEPFYASQMWHVVHCTFNWRKQFRQPKTGVVIEHEADSIHHVTHCEDIFKMRIPLTQIATISGVGLNMDIIRHKEGSDSENPY